MAFVSCSRCVKPVKSGITLRPYNASFRAHDLPVIHHRLNGALSNALIIITDI
jgi:hypothetical protein